MQALIYIFRRIRDYRIILGDDGKNEFKNGLVCKFSVSLFNKQGSFSVMLQAAYHAVKSVFVGHFFENK